MWDKVAQEALQIALLGVNSSRSNKFSREALIRAIQELCRSLTKERGGRDPRYMSDGQLRAAYLAAYAVPNALRVCHLITREVPKGTSCGRLLDIGAGPLAASIGVALSPIGSTLRQVVAVDTSAPAMRDGAALVASVAPEVAVRRVCASLVGRRGRLPPGPFDGAVIANLLSELQGPRGRNVDRALNIVSQAVHSLRPGGWLLVVEPGTRVAARQLMATRDAVVKWPVSVIAPCTGASRCPLLRSGSWCHTTLRIKLPEPVAGLRRSAGLGTSEWHCSYLLMIKGDRAPNGRVRLVSDPMTRGAHPSGYVCTREGRRTIELPQRGGQHQRRTPRRGELLNERAVPPAEHHRRRPRR